MAYYDFEANEPQNLIIRRKSRGKKKYKIIFFSALADTRYGISADGRCRGGSRYFWSKWNDNGNSRGIVILIIIGRSIIW